MKYVLGIETSCDDTSVAIVDEGGRVCANVVSSQVEEHAPFGGVVPELASRAHLSNLPRVMDKALADAGLSLDRISAVAVTQGPGLIGSLLVGISFAKALAFARELPLIPVNHIRGHVRALALEFDPVPRPALALIVSGGHTHLFRWQPDDAIVLLTKTRDDAAGEAFDKLAKMLDLGFPGGPLVDRLAAEGDPRAFEFSMPRFRDGSADYSFSGLKTAAAMHLKRDPHAFRDPSGQRVKDLCASFQAAVVKHLLQRVKQALKREPAEALLLGGGVACNSGLRRAFEALAKQAGLPAMMTSPVLSTDNAAMIAAEGWHLWRAGVTADWDLNPNVSLKAYDEVRFLANE